MICELAGIEGGRRGGGLLLLAWLLMACDLKKNFFLLSFTLLVCVIKE